MKFVCSPIDRPRWQDDGRHFPLSPFGSSRKSVSPLRASIGTASGTVIRPMFTSRVHKAPAPRGHRQFILAKQEWR